MQRCPRSLRLDLLLLLPLISALLLSSSPTLFLPTPALAAVESSSFVRSTFPEDSTQTTALAVGDVDGDGDLDVITGSSNANRLYLNNGSRNPFTRVLGIPLGSNRADALALGDVDGDGDLDLISANSNGMQLWINNGSATPFSGVVPVSIGSGGAAALILRDLNGDGALDLISGTDGPNRILINNGSANPFAGVTALAISSDTDATNALAVGDVNGDGHLDLIAGNNGVNRLYLNNGSNNPFQGVSGTNVSSDSANTRTLALGDLDGDGDLDLIAGNNGFNRIYLNNGSNAPFQTVLGTNLGTVADDTRALALGDLDGDGDLDLIVAGQQNRRLYLNPGTPTGLTAVSGVSLGDASTTTSALMLADLDGDGDLDLLLGNASTNQLLLNIGQLEPFAQATANTIAFTNLPAAAAIALGDLNGDGALDLVAGGTGRRKLFLNTRNNPPFTGSGSDITTDTSPVNALVLGDVDGDGDLDLISGGSQVQLYLNTGRNPPFAIISSGTQIGNSSANALALGDLDGDGDLDLVVAGTNGVLVYLNNGTATPFDGVPGRRIANDFERVNALALGDLNGDGNLDIVAGTNVVNRFYLNNGTNAPFDNVLGNDIGFDSEPTNAVVLGDIDGDGNLDLVVGNTGLNRIYLNNGSAAPFTEVAGRGIGGETDDTRSLALSDLDGDGDLDLVVGNIGLNLLYLNNGSNTPFIASSLISNDADATQAIVVGDLNRDGLPDVVTVAGTNTHKSYLHPQARLDDLPTAIVIERRADGTALADFFSTATTLNRQMIDIPFTLRDRDSDPVAQVIGEYSLNGGGNWLPAVAAEPAVNLASSPGGIGHVFRWDVYASGLFGQSDHVVFRLRSIPGAASAITPALRVRGIVTQVVDLNGDPAAGAIVYRRAANGVGAATPLLAGTNIATTNAAGFLGGTNHIDLNDRLFAVQPIMATDVYTLYLTSADLAQPNLDDPATAMQRVTNLGVQRVQIRNNPLILFNLDVSLEWDARGDPQYLSRLEADLNRAAEQLYDWSDGQAALGSIRVYHARERWNDAHIRIYATNTMRPNAVKGGIVAPGQSVVDPDVATITYTTGQIRMGAIWNRYGEASANLGEDWPRTLAHELGHYLFYLDDNYLGLRDGVLTTVSGCQSAMSDPYRNDYTEFAPRDAAWEQNCTETLSEQLTGRADWETITAFYNSTIFGQEIDLRVPAIFNARPGPANLPVALTQVQFREPAEPNRTISVPIFLTADAATNVRYQPSPEAQALLFQGDQLIDLGRPTLDQINARGARRALDDTPADRLCLYDLGVQRMGCRAVSVGDSRLPVYEYSTWQPDIALTPLSLTELEVRVTQVDANITQPLKAQLYPSSAAAGPPIELELNGLTYSGVFTRTIDSPAFDGYVHLWVDEDEEEIGRTRREAIADFRLGGNPGSAWGRNAPRGNPGSAWGRNAPVLSGDGRAILFGDNLAVDLEEGQFYALQALGFVPNPLAWATPIGRAYRLSASPGTDLANTSINIAYDGADVPPGEEPGVSLYYLDEATRTWQQLPTRRDTFRNEASALVVGPGVYALMSSFEIRLTAAGWNLFAYPVADRALPAALAGIDGRYDALYGFDGSSADPWQLYAPQAPSWVNDLTMLEQGRAYWIRTTEALTVPLSSRVTLAQVLNPGAPPATLYGIAPEGVAADTPVIATINGVTCATSSTRQFEAQIVFVIDVPSAGAGELAECGIPGRTITLTIGDSVFRTSWASGPRDLFGAWRIYVPLVGS